MNGSIHKAALVVAFFGLIQACATRPVIFTADYDQSARSHLYDLKTWAFQGRLAMRGAEDSWSASINWRHKGDTDKIKLAGPLGQGAVAINLTGNAISIDRGDGKPLASNNPDALVRQQVGVFVPVKALRYWVAGLTQPSVEFDVLSDGFIQSGWTVHYPEFIRAGEELMPRRIVVINKKLKLKLVVDRWVLNDDVKE